MKGAYERDALPQRVLMFGTGMLLRALVATAVDDANRRGRDRCGILALQSTNGDRAAALTKQNGLFTLLERGVEDGALVDRARVIGSITAARALHEDASLLRDIAANPDLRVVVSNVSEAGFAPGPFPAHLTDLLIARFERAQGGAPLFVIPTELVPDNGPRLRALIDDEVARRGLSGAFTQWLDESVRFCSSLVDRITTRAPERERDELAARFGYTDELITVTEPHALWAIECDPDEFRAAFPIDDGNRVVFARDISPYRDRKLRLLNGAHTAMAPIALLAGLATVHDATTHETAGAFFRRLLFDELVPGSGVDAAQAESYAHSVWERFRNPWLAHEWAVIANNQNEKMRIRVMPSVMRYMERFDRAPAALSCAIAAHLVRAGATPQTLDTQTLAQAVARPFAEIQSSGVVAAMRTVLATPVGGTTP